MLEKRSEEYAGRTHQPGLRACSGALGEECSQMKDSQRAISSCQERCRDAARTSPGAAGAAHLHFGADPAPCGEGVARIFGEVGPAAAAGQARGDYGRPWGE